MLAAAPAPEARMLELFRLALGIANSNRVVPEKLIDYFNTVLAQARALDNDPQATVDAVMPEAIQLALDIRDRAELRKAVKDIKSFHDITPTKAADVLRHLEEIGAP